MIVYLLSEVQAAKKTQLRICMPSKCYGHLQTNSGFICTFLVQELWLYMKWKLISKMSEWNIPAPSKIFRFSTKQNQISLNIISTNLQLKIWSKLILSTFRSGTKIEFLWRLWKFISNYFKKLTKYERLSAWRFYQQISIERELKVG